jgi:deoxyribodipyrimidine photolyase
MIFNPSRTAALEQLLAFVPHAATYARSRNFVLGTGQHIGVSQLSPFIRARLITEEEVTRAVLAVHSAHAAEKFLQEIAWRTYWKGWLEMRPDVWLDYRESLSKIEKSSTYFSAIHANTGTGSQNSHKLATSTTTRACGLPPSGFSLFSSHGSLEQNFSCIIC